MANVSRKISAGSNFVLFLIIMAGFFALINFLSARHFGRLDLTATKVYSLSDATKKIAANLDDVVTITCYFSTKLPSYVLPIKQRVKDTLSEYQAYAKGTIQVEFVDPSEDPEIEKRMRFIGIPEVQMNIWEKDQATATKAYMGIAVTYEDRQEVIPFLKDTNNLEYDLTTAILKVVRKEKKTIGFLSGHSEYDIYEGYSTVRSALGKQYAVEKVDTAGGKAIPNTIDVLVVAGPDGLTERDKYEIDQYIMAGGKVFFFIDIITIPEGTVQASYRQSNISDLLENYGVKVTRDLVLDRMNMLITYQTGYTIVRTPYPFFPKVIEAGFDQENPIVNQLESLVLPWPAALETLPDSHPEANFTVLAKSSPYSWLQKGMYNINPGQDFMPEQEKDMQQYALAVWTQGRFKSFFAGKDVPPMEKSEEDQSKSSESADKDRTTIPESQKETQILVVGNGRFLENNFVGNPGNMEFFLNALDWATWGKDLIGIRSRSVTDKPIPILTEQQKRVLKFANMLAIPILVALFGFIRFYLKSRKKITLQDLG